MTEHITIILITYGNSPERTEYAVRTVKSIEKYLHYENWSWYVSDDGSPASHVSRVLEEINKSGHTLIDWHTDRISYGAGANRGLLSAFQHGELVLMLEDDWELNRDIDIWKWASLLMERPDVGMVRMGYLNAGVSATVFGHSGSLYWALDDSQSKNYSSFAFAGHPSLIHKRFFDHVGLFPEKYQPGDTELGMAWKVASVVGPRVVWPVELGERGPFDAIGKIQSYEWTGPGICEEYR